MSIEEKIKTAKEDSWLKDSVSEKGFKEIKDNERRMTKVDLISRKEVLNAIGEEKWEYLDYLERDIGGNYDVHILGFTEQIEKRIEELPTYSPTFKPIAKIEIDSDEVAKKVLEEIKNDSAEQRYSWCDGCKEYDTEKHCCHRYSSFIRESLQENIKAVLEDIKAEFVKRYPHNYCGEPELGGVSCVFSLNKVLEIIDRHISGKEE